MQNTLILNIGLARDGCPDTDPADVIRSLMHGFELFDLSQRVIFRVVQSNTEPTLCIAGTLKFEVPILPDNVNTTYLEGVLADVSEHFGQDCIAWKVLSLHTAQQACACGLAGPRAAEWGPFNPDYFIPA